MGIFCEKWAFFSKVFVVLEARIQALVVRKAIRKMTGSLRGAKLYFFLDLITLIYMYIF
jgi:hypothetical protein